MVNRIRRLAIVALRPLFALQQRLLPIEPWHRINDRLPSARFGVGSQREFAWYFERTSTVHVATLEDVCDWLVECEYVPDPELFGEIDHWQHPTDFEVRRKGDCEDHALWAWRKLTELGVPAEFYIGRRRSRADGTAHFHAWVVCRCNDREYLLETTARSRAEVLQYLDDVRAEYEPHCAVDAQFRTYAFGGHLVYADERRS